MLSQREAPITYSLDIEIKGEEKKGSGGSQKRFVRKTPMRPLSLSPLTLNSCPLPFSIKVAALDFIDKTLSEEEFKERISSAIDYTLEQAGTTIAQDAFTFEGAMARVQVPFNKILYVETSPAIHKVILHTQEERLNFTLVLPISKSRSPLVSVPPAPLW